MNTILEIEEQKRFGFDDDEFFDFCQQNDGLSFERDEQGNILVMPNTGGRTGQMNFELSIEFGIWNRINQLGVCFDSSTAFKLPSSAVRSPDVAYVSHQRWETLTAKEQRQFPPLCPDFVLELMSDSDDLKEARRKMQDEWIGNGCRLAWLMYPAQETVYIYRQNGEIQIVTGFDKILSGEDVLVGFELNLSKLKK
jgi:Uma2 family endonuclease